MDTALTTGEIKTRFDGEWVLIEDPITDDNLEIQGGTVKRFTRRQRSCDSRGRRFCSSVKRPRKWNTSCDHDV